MINGGYIMIDFSGLSLSNAESQTIPGIYFSLDTAIKAKKPVIGYNLAYNDNIVFCRNINLVKTESSIVCTTDALTITVTSNDAVVVSETASGTSDYEDLDNLPKINNVELKGNVALSTLGAATSADIAALQPVDSVTDGNAHPVTSNAVADALKQESVTVTKENGDTYATLLARLFAAMDFTKLKPTSKLVRGTSVYNLSILASESATFNKDVIYGATTNYAEFNSITISSAPVCVSLAVSPQSITTSDFSTNPAPDAITIYY